MIIPPPTSDILPVNSKPRPFTVNGRNTTTLNMPCCEWKEHHDRQYALLSMEGTPRPSICPAVNGRNTTTLNMPCCQWKEHHDRQYALLSMEGTPRPSICPAVNGRNTTTVNMPCCQWKEHHDRQYALLAMRTRISCVYLSGSQWCSARPSGSVSDATILYT